MDKILTEDFYSREDVVQISIDLLGKTLTTYFGGVRTSGVIVETEAYAGPVDRAAHSFGGRKTKRTAIMYHSGGVAYVYLCYGIHHLFNVITNVAGIPHAVLIRAIEPFEGLDIMLERRGKTKVDRTLTGGPGALSSALGIHTSHTGLPLSGEEIRISDTGITYLKEEIIASPRVGVSYAGRDALFPWRFRVKGSTFTSPAK